MSALARAGRRPLRSSASVAMGFVTGMLSGMQRLQRDPAPLLKRAGVRLDDPAGRVALDRYALLYNLVIAELEDESFGVLSRPMPPGSFEFLCRGMLGASTLENALDRARRFLRITLPDLSLAVHRDGHRAALEITDQRSPRSALDDPARIFAFEWLLRLLHGVACWFVGRGLALDTVSFPYAAPAHVDDYALVYTEHSTFGSDRLIARLQANLLDLPIHRDEAALDRFLAGAPGRISMLYRRDREMVLRVRDLIRSSLPENLSLEEAAQRLHLSTRTLHRRLEEEGSGFRTIKDALRRDIAFSRLARSAQPIASLAADLGYADTSAFYRAFVSWSGVSPERFRARLAASARSSTPPAASD